MGHQQGWIGIDLDGTLAYYDRWRGIEHVGAPIEAMVQRVRDWAAENRPMKIFTARVCVPEPERSMVIQHIHDWLESHGLPILEVTNIKDFAMIELWDDRAVQVQINTGRRMDCLDNA